MASSPPHIPFPVASAALQADRLAWLLEHQEQISMDRDFELGIYQLIIAKDPERLLTGSAAFAERFEQTSDRRVLGG
jgi:hypothetical protein